MMIVQLRASNPDVKEAVAKMAEEATVAGASTIKRDVANLTSEARGIISLCTALRHHHPAREAEPEVQTLALAPLRAGGVEEMLGNA
jgi:hypothetical protein